MKSQEVKEIFDSDVRIEYIREYPEGFVPNSYRWRVPGTYNIYYRDGRSGTGIYDRKRSHGIGPRWVAYSARHGRLASG